MLTCQSLTCVRDGRILFRELGFTLLPGGLLAVAGPNGSGKTSLLRVIAGLLAPQKGEILWEGTPGAQSHDYRRHMLYLGHQNAVKPQETVGQHLAFWARLRGEPMLIPAALRYWGLEGKEEIACAQLSAGWQRRLALARLMVIPGLFWLLDEPATHLDEEGKALLDGMIAGKCRQGGMVIVTMHQVPAGLPALQMEDYR